jgi:hypothetical protein
MGCSSTPRRTGTPRVHVPLATGPNRATIEQPAAACGCTFDRSSHRAASPSRSSCTPKRPTDSGRRPHVSFTAPWARDRRFHGRGHRFGSSNAAVTPRSHATVGRAELWPDSVGDCNRSDNRLIERRGSMSADRRRRSAVAAHMPVRNAPLPDVVAGDNYTLEPMCASERCGFPGVAVRSSAAPRSRCPASDTWTAYRPHRLDAEHERPHPLRRRPGQRDDDHRLSQPHARASSATSSNCIRRFCSQAQAGGRRCAEWRQHGETARWPPRAARGPVLVVDESSAWLEFDLKARAHAA